MAGKLITICGLPGSGKTTHAKALERSLSAVRFCADDWMNALSLNLWDESARGKIEALQWMVAQRLIAIEQTVLIEWGTWGRAERDALREGARALCADVELHYVSAPLDVISERIQRRQMEEPPILREQIEIWAKSFHVPTAEESALYDHFWSNTRISGPQGTPL
jgi:predicted kinase